MRFTNLLAVTLAGFSGLSSAWISSFYVNEVTKPGDKITLILRGKDYVQAVGESAAVFGLAPHNLNDASIGSVIGTVLTSDYSNKVGNFTYHATIPADTKKGKYAFRVGLFGTYGANSAPDSIIREASIVIGDKTSSNYVESTLPVITPP